MNWDTDGCDKQIGCVLLQENPYSTSTRSGCWYRYIIDAKHRYDNAHREFLAVQRSLLLLRRYLKGATILIHTDDDSLCCLLNMADATHKLARWRLRLEEMDVEVVHRVGIKHQATDALPRFETEVEDRLPLGDDLP